MTATCFREMYPIARELIGKLFSALQQEAENLVSQDKSKMSLVERGRWTSQALRLMKSLQKEFPEADHNTEEGRRTINRLRTPEEDEEEAAEIDALFGFDRQESSPRPKPPVTARATNWREASVENGNEGDDQFRSRPMTNEGRPIVVSPQPQHSSNIADDPGAPIGPPIDYDAEIAEIIRRVRPVIPYPPS